MYKNFIISLEAVLPMFMLMAVGVVVRKMGLLKDDEIKHLNKMVFAVCFSSMMFENIYTADIKAAFNVRLMAFGVAWVLITLAVSLPFVLRIEKNQKTRGAMLQAIYRSNFVIMGMPIALSMYGKGNIAVTAMMISVIVPLYNILAVVILEIFRGGRPDPANILKSLLKNPLIIGAVAGITAVLTGLKIPDILNVVISDLSNTATPMALIILGASFNFKSIRRCGRNLLICLISRLVIVPGVVLSAAVQAGFRGIEFVTLIAIFAAPTAVSSFTMAQSMDSDGELAGNCVIFSSALACITMFLWIFLFKNIGIF